MDEWIGQALGGWQVRELRIARGFRECQGLSTEQLEDIYQETAVSLLRRAYLNEEHLCKSLRKGLKYRALNMHRDQRRRGEILAAHAPGLYVTAQAREEQNDPELAAFAQHDDLVEAEFQTELTHDERSVFELMKEGLRYRAIAPRLKMEINQARKIARSCERKRERFKLLHDNGRLCAFRASAILALQNGEIMSEELTRRALAHLKACPRCRAEYKGTPS
jgi:DNA-directed RNA polymerase specialized sigma24 family protein